MAGGTHVGASLVAVERNRRQWSLVAGISVPLELQVLWRCGLGGAAGWQESGRAEMAGRTHAERPETAWRLSLRSSGDRGPDLGLHWTSH